MAWLAFTLAQWTDAAVEPAPVASRVYTPMGGSSASISASDLLRELQRRRPVLIQTPGPVVAVPEPLPRPQARVRRRDDDLMLLELA